MLAVILVGMFITVLNQTFINIALPPIMAQFNIDAATAQWLSTGYILVIGILVPISAFLVQRFSYKQLFLTAMTFLYGKLIYMCHFNSIYNAAYRQNASGGWRRNFVAAYH